jgi:hypothetical protein
MTSLQIHFPNDKEAQNSLGKGLSLKGYLRLLEADFPDNPKEIRHLLKGEFANVEDAMKEIVKVYGTKMPYVPQLWALLAREKLTAILFLDNGRILAFTPPKGFVWPKEELRYLDSI